MVSHRRSLYRQSTGRGASYGNDLEETITHWERVWVAPLPISTSSANGSAPVNSKSGISSTRSPAGPSASSGGAGEEDQGTAQLSFKVKVWAQLENQADFVALKDGDDDDYINLVAATNQAQSRKTNAGGQATNDSLSAADIRGAVGGGEEISISSYTSNEAKPKAAAAAPESAATEKPAAESETKSTETPADKTAEPVAPKEESAKPEESTESVKEDTKDTETTESVAAEEPKSEAQSTSESQAAEPKTDEKGDVEMEDSAAEKKPEEDAKPTDEASESKATEAAAADGDVDMEDS